MRHLSAGGALVTLAVALVVLAACEWAAFTARAVNPYPGDAAAAARGQALFAQTCTPCHGEGGRGDGPTAPTLRLRPPDFTDRGRMVSRGDPDLFWAISRGRGNVMPSFRDQLSEGQIWDLVNYIRTFHAAPP